jgi:uncharacterized Fe-S cluster-containing radical SAM superfamily enzyme
MAAELSFQDLYFEENKDKLKVYFLKYFYFEIPNSELQKISEFTVKDSTISFETTQNKAERLFNRLISQYIESELKTLKGTKAVYIYKPPVVGSLRFGLVDRDTNLIEVRPITGCNLNCIYCSVGEGIESDKIDYVVSKDLLISEFKKLAEKKTNIEAHIGPQGEPLMYAHLAELIKGLKAVDNVNVISIDTNGVLLTPEIIDKLADAGLTRVNLSMNALDPELAKKLAGTGYKMDLIIAPVMLSGINEQEMPKIIEFAKSIRAKVGIQNFLEYSGGRNPVKQIEWPDFYSKLKKWELDYGVKLILTKEDFGISKQKTLEKPFKKNQTIEAEIIYDEYAGAKSRLIKIPFTKIRGRARVKITRDKDNVYFGIVL